MSPWVSPTCIRGVPEPLRLPRAATADVPAAKLRDYALDPGHRIGRHKARMFARLLSIEREDRRFLSDQILDRLPESPVTAIRPKPPYGTEYEVRVSIDGRNGETHSVITGWLVPEEGPPRLLTAYVEVPRRA